MRITGFVLILSMLFMNTSCKGPVTGKELFDSPTGYAYLEDLYYGCDSLIRKPDTVMIINSRMDTVIVETGIFSCLQYDYLLTSPVHDITALCKRARTFEEKGSHEKARKQYLKIIEHYEYEREKDLERFSCSNNYYQYCVNGGIIYSYAFEKLGSLDKAIEMLKPYLANAEAWRSDIHKRFIELCIEKYGKEKVRDELAACTETVKKNTGDGPVDAWVVTVFRADIGLEGADFLKKVTPAQADSMLRKQDLYRLVN